MKENAAKALLKIIIYIAALLLIAFVFMHMKHVGYTIMADEAKDAPQEAVETVLTVTERESILAIAKDLSEQDIIGNPYLFAVSLRCMEGYQNIKPGTYEVKSSEKPSDILKKLTHEEENDG